MAGNGRRRRGRTSAFEDFVDLVALLPWWAGVLLAVVLYVWLHGVAIRPTAIVGTPGQLGSSVARTLWTTMALYLQYLLPLASLIGAALSAWRRHERRRLAADVGGKPSAAGALDGMSWQRFELLVGEAFRQQGYRVVETGGGGADGGVDLVLRKGDGTFLVQCKQWRAYKVGVDVVRQLYGVMAARGAAGGFVVSAGRFTADARDFASGRNIELIEGERLHAMLQRAAAGEKAATAAGRDAKAGQEDRSAQPSDTAAVPGCPRCGKPMLRRVARQGANAGRAFWGCSAYPACRGTLEMTELRR
jgi:restriction system protein